MSLRNMTVQYIGSMLTTPPFEREVKRIEVGGVTFVPERTCRNISDPPEGFYCSSCHWGDFAEPSHLLTASKYTGRESGGPNYCPNCGAKVVSE